MEEDEEEIPKNKLLLLILLLTITTLFNVSAAAATDGGDAAIMANLAKSLSPPPSGWSGTNPCKWTGVTCDSSGRVTSINLSTKSLSGELPSDLNQLSHLKSLSLQRNQLSGPLPSLSNLTSLEEVILDSNNFTSVPPSFLSGLTSLQSFSINENPNLPPWMIPETLADSTMLNSLLASKSNVAGTIPDIFGSFPNLQNLRLSYNNLSGSLPPSLAKSGIQNLWVNNQMTGLSGALDVLGTMPQLNQVWLHANKFSGPIPDLSESTSLFDLQLRDNELTGVIPPSLTSLPKLVNVTLQNNKFQGPFPNFPKGVQVTLGSENSFCNPSPGPCDPQVTTLLAIAGALGYPMSLAESWQGNNPCNGWNFVSCDTKGAVTVLNFAKQHWSGMISPAIANLTALKSALLNDNSLTGGIPASLTSLPQLKLLDISNNNLSGKIPSFGSGVSVKTSGNPLIGKDVVPSEGGSSSNASSGERSSSSGTSNSSGRTNTLSGGTSTNTKSWFIAGTIVVAVIFIVVLSLVIYKRFVRKRSGKYKWAHSIGKDKGNGYGGISEPTSQGSADNDDFQVYDGGNVAIPIEILREVTNNFSEDNILGQGGFGVVYGGKFHDGTQIAVKRMESAMASSKGLSEFRAEIAVLTKVRHRHLVALLGFCVDGNERLLVYEYMPQGTLSQHLFNNVEMGIPRLTWKQRVTIALDVARGVEYLHSLAQQSFIHRDLKPSNILLGDDLRGKVSDFGLVKNAPDGKYSVETRLAGTFGYLAPEYAATGRVTTKIDVFAFGVVLMEIITGRKALDESLPEEKSHLVTWFRRILNNKDSIRKSLDPSLDPDEETFKSICTVAELAGHCTNREPSQRPDMSHAVNVLSPLVVQWKPTSHDEEDSFSVGLHLSLPQALQRWQDSEGNSSMMSSDLYNSYTSTSSPRKLAGFGNSFRSKGAR